MKIEEGKTKCGNAIFSKAMSSKEAFRKEHSMEYKTASNIRDMTFFCGMLYFKQKRIIYQKKP